MREAIAAVFGAGRTSAWRHYFVWTALILIGALPVNAQGNSGRRDTFQQIPAIVIDLDQTGFHPAVVRCKAGTVLLKIRNSSGRKNVNFRFDRVGGGASKTQVLNANTPTFREVVALTAGEYTVTATHDKTLTVRIVVQ